MKFANKILITTSIVLFKNVRVFSQGTYNWKEHSEAMDKINWNDAISENSRLIDYSVYFLVCARVYQILNELDPPNW